MVNASIKKYECKKNFLNTIVGEYSAPGATICVLCPKGHKCVTTSVAVRCSGGTYSSLGGS